MFKALKDFEHGGQRYIAGRTYKRDMAVEARLAERGKAELIADRVRRTIRRRTYKTAASEPGAETRDA